MEKNTLVVLTFWFIIIVSSAMYPSASSELHIEIDATVTTFDEVLLKEIKALVQRLPTGRLMVLRLCREVSQYVHSSYK